MSHTVKVSRWSGQWIKAGGVKVRCSIPLFEFPWRWKVPSRKVLRRVDDICGLHIIFVIGEAVSQ